MKKIFALALLIPLLVSSCASKGGKRTVQFTINSVPQGAYVTFEHGSGNAQFLGNTPVSITREIDFASVGGSTELTLRAMFPGYFDGTKIYTYESFNKEAKAKGGIFWNFNLVPSNRMIGDENVPIRVR